MLNEGWNYSQVVLGILSAATFFGTVSVLFSAPKVWKRKGRAKVRTYLIYWCLGSTIKVGLLATFGYFGFGVGEYKPSYKPALPDIPAHANTYKMLSVVMGTVFVFELWASIAFALGYSKYYLMISNTMLLKSKLPEKEVERRRTKRLENNIAKRREEKGLVTVDEVSETDKDKTAFPQNKTVGTSWRADHSYAVPSEGIPTIKESSPILEEDEDA